MSTNKTLVVFVFYYNCCPIVKTKLHFWLSMMCPLRTRHWTYQSWVVDCFHFLCHCSEQTQWLCMKLLLLLEVQMMWCQLVYVVSHCNCPLHQKYSWGCNESLGALTAQARVPEVWESNCLSVTWKCPCPLSVSCSVHWSTMAWIWSSAIPNIEKASKFQFKVWLQ